MDPSPGAPARSEVRLLSAPFQPLEELAAWQVRLGIDGATAAQGHFIGRVRETTADGAPLEALELEHYPGMTDAQLEAIAADGAARHGVAALLVLHRVGRIAPGEAIVLVAVAADRRGPCLRCLQDVLETLKHDAPFWKREWSGGTGTWVTGNTPL
jgi:molybdopterin synthase catalytic subunit